MIDDLGLVKGEESALHFGAGGSTLKHALTLLSSRGSRTLQSSLA